MSSKSCPKCARRMEEGFVVDIGDASMPTVGHWHPGKPLRKWWGLKLDKHSKREITMWRCTGCGYLESYAA